MVARQPFFQSAQRGGDAMYFVPDVDVASVISKLGVGQRDLVRSGREALPRSARGGRLLGLYHRKASLHAVRHLPLRSALAPGIGCGNVDRALWRERVALALAAAPRDCLACRTRGDRRTHVGRSVWSQLRRERALGRINPDATAHNLRHRLCFSAFDPARRWPALSHCR